MLTDEEANALPKEWEVEDFEMTVTATRVYIVVSGTTAQLLASVLSHHGTTADAWIADKCLAEADTIDALRPATPSPSEKT
jgi:hypothetical protein